VRKILAVFLLLGALAGMAVAGAAYFGYRAVRPVVDEATAWASRARDVTGLPTTLDNREPFTPPAGGELDEARVRRFLAVQARVREAMGARWAEVEAQARVIETKARADGDRLSVADLRALVSGVGSLVRDARRAQVAALDAEGFSSGEYAWTRLRVYEAAGLEVADRLDWNAVESLLQDAAEHAGLSPPRLPVPDIPGVNRELVRPHLQDLRTWLPLVLIGL
jgi:hypothetical protein